MIRHKRVVKVIYNDITYDEKDEDTTRLRNYMVLILPKNFDPKCKKLLVEGGINFVGSFTTGVGFNSNICTIVKPSPKDYLELALAMKYKHAYKSKNERRRG